jgi:hypothetical protein
MVAICVYQEQINLILFKRSTSNQEYYIIDFKIEETVHEHFYSWKNYYNSAPGSTYADSTYYSTQLSMNAGEKFSMYCTHNYNTNTVPNCKANGVTVGCAFIQGKLVQRH